MNNLKEFEVDGVKYFVKAPSDLDIRQADNIYAREFNKLLKEGELSLRSELEKVAKERGVWTDEEEGETAVLRKELNELDEKLSKGGYEKSEAIKDALRMKEIRSELLGKSLALNYWLSQSVENVADTKRNDYLVSVSILDENMKPLCKDVDDYLNRVNDDPVLTEGTNIFLYGDSNVEDIFNNFTPEMKVLNMLGYSNEKEEQVESKPFLENGVPIANKKKPSSRKKKEKKENNSS